MIVEARGSGSLDDFASGWTTLRGQLSLGESMSRHTSWRVGGPAQRAYRPADLQDLAAFLAGLPADEPVLFVGLGSNLLVRDGGIQGTVIFTHGILKTLGLDPDRKGVLYAEAGVASPKVARFTAMCGLQGAEFLSGIPGTVGGALAMNAGCYGQQTWEIVEEVLTVDRDGELRKRPGRQFAVGYREVALKPRYWETSVEGRERDSLGGEWFVAAWLRLRSGEREAARERIRALLTRRVATQPLDRPNAGSVFRNPPGDFAARLIEACGLKGQRLGNAQISAKHANFIVNLGGARAADIEALMDWAERSVAERFGIRLEREVRVVGESRAPTSPETGGAAGER